MRRVFIIVFTLFIFSTTYAVIGTGGGAGAFLRMGAGARPISLSGAFGAYYDDVTAPYWNPAATVYIDKIAISSMYSWLEMDMGYNFFNGVFPTEYGGFGINIINFSSGDIEGRESETDPYFAFQESGNVFFLTYAREISKGIAVGGNIKVVNISIYNEGAMGMSMDIGFLLTVIDNVSFAIIMQDFLDTGVRWTTGTTDDVPYVFRTGVMGKLWDDNIRLSFGGEQVENEEVYVKAGIEGAIFRVFFLRAGCSYGFKSYDFNYTLGGGLKYTASGITGQLDYALMTNEYYGPQNVIVPKHQLSLSVYLTP